MYTCTYMKGEGAFGVQASINHPFIRIIANPFSANQEVGTKVLRI